MIAATSSACPRLRLVGLHVHIGSQVTRTEPLARAAAGRRRPRARPRGSRASRIEHLDLGGGLGIAYEPGQTVLSPDEYAAAVLPAVRRYRSRRCCSSRAAGLSGPAGVLADEVVDLKAQPGGGWFVVVDAGMTDLIRPALYGAWHGIEPVGPPRRRAAFSADIVGPVCETSDTLGRRPRAAAASRSATCWPSATRARTARSWRRTTIAGRWPRKCMVDDRHVARSIRRRQTIDDMLQWDV